MAKSAEFKDLSRVRNVGIAAHVDAGKTTLTERVLYYTGANHKIGEVHDGAAHMDFIPEEQAHGITIGSAVTRCPWRDHLIQIVDTPGHVDFTIEVERAMRVLDGAVIVMDAVRGVEPQTETVWRQASRFDIPRAVFINKMDRPGASFERCMESLEKKLGAHPVPVCVPLANGTVIDLVNQELVQFSGSLGQEVSRGPVPAEHAALMEEHRESLLLACAEVDETLEEAVLEGEPVRPAQIWSALRRATIDGHAHPVFGGSALRNFGVQPLLDGLLEIMPAPRDRPPTVARDGEDEVFVEMDPAQDLVALAFKIQLWDGRRHVFARIYRGTLKPGDKVAIAGKDIVERVARVFDVDANSKKRIDAAEAGQIVLLAGLRKAGTGDTLCTPGSELLLESIDTKEPVLGLAVEPESSKDEAKFLDAIAKVCEEDPTLRFAEDPDTGQQILNGMGELHLMIVFERLEREFGIKVRAGRPRVMTRETVAGPGRSNITLERTLRMGDKEVLLKARCRAEVAPAERGSGVSAQADPKVLPPGASLSPAQLEAIQLGTTDATLGGPIEGAPLQDVAVRLTEVELFEEASSPQALRIAASQAVRMAMQEGGGQVLKPLMRVGVVVPDEYMGGVFGDLQARRANILGQESEMGFSTIQAECSLDQLIGYMTALRGMTRGHGQFTMEFARFDVA